MELRLRLKCEGGLKNGEPELSSDCQAKERAKASRQPFPIRVRLFSRGVGRRCRHRFRQPPHRREKCEQSDRCSREKWDRETIDHQVPIRAVLVFSFPHVLWPMYAPVIMGFLEAVPWRKKGIFAFEAAGVAVGLYLRYLIVTRPLTAEVAGRHTRPCVAHFYLIPVMTLFLAATWVSVVSFRTRP